MKTPFAYIFLVVIAVSFVHYFYTRNSAELNITAPPKQPTKQHAKGVIKVVKCPKFADKKNAVLDGNHFYLNNFHYKLYGIAAPDIDETCLDKSGNEWPCGESAKLLLDSLIIDDATLCVAKAVTDDGICISECSVNGRNINAVMVQSGFAKVNTNETDKYTSEESYARSTKLGIWTNSE